VEETCGNHHAFPVEVRDGFFGHAEIIGQQVPRRLTAGENKPECSHVTRDKPEPDALHPLPTAFSVNSNPIPPNRATARKSSPKNPAGSSGLATILMNVGMVPLYGCCFGKAGANDNR
jgi:hypothetical protein